MTTAQRSHLDWPSGDELRGLLAPYEDTTRQTGPLGSPLGVGWGTPGPSHQEHRTQVNCAVLMRVLTARCGAHKKCSH